MQKNRQTESPEVRTSNILPLSGLKIVSQSDHSFPVVSPKDLSRIRTLRKIAQDSLLHSQEDLDHAFTANVKGRQETIVAIGLALFGALAKYASKQLVIHSISATTLSESEIWLCRMIMSYEVANTAQGRALVAWRVKPEGQRRVGYLAGMLADEFQRLEKEADP